MIGDHANDIACAAALDLPSIFVTWGYGQATGTYTAQNPSDLPALVDAFANNHR